MAKTYRVITKTLPRSIGSHWASQAAAKNSSFLRKPKMPTLDATESDAAPENINIDPELSTGKEEEPQADAAGDQSMPQSAATVDDEPSASLPATTSQTDAPDVAMEATAEAPRAEVDADAQNATSRINPWASTDTNTGGQPSEDVPSESVSEAAEIATPAAEVVPDTVLPNPSDTDILVAAFSVNLSAGGDAITQMRPPEPEPKDKAHATDDASATPTAKALANQPARPADVGTADVSANLISTESNTEVEATPPRLQPQEQPVADVAERPILNSETVGKAAPGNYQMRGAAPDKKLAQMTFYPNATLSKRIKMIRALYDVSGTQIVEQAVDEFFARNTDDQIGEMICAKGFGVRRTAAK